MSTTPTPMMMVERILKGVIIFPLGFSSLRKNLKNFFTSTAKSGFDICDLFNSVLTFCFVLLTLGGIAHGVQEGRK